MPTREEMRSLAEEIIHSYEDRIAGIAELRQGEAERKRTDAQEIAQRKSDVSTMLKGFAQGDAERRSEVSTMLKGFDDSHAAMSNSRIRIRAYFAGNVMRRSDPLLLA